MIGSPGFWDIFFMSSPVPGLPWSGPRIGSMHIIPIVGYLNIILG
jgi:hypothetical protein